MAGLAETELDQSPLVLWMKRGMIALVIGALIAGAVLLVSKLTKPSAAPSRQAKIKLVVPDTPPPPPPPPKEEKKPEPPKDSPKEVKIEQPKTEAPPQQPAETLKMEGAGSDNGIAGIGSGTVQNDYVGQKIGSESTGGGDRFKWYGGLIQAQIQAALARNAKLRGRDYRVNVRVWLLPNGTVERAELAASSGNEEVDEQVRLALAEMPPLSERPPEGLPQPVKLRVTSRS